MDKCPVCRTSSRKWTHVRPGCRDLVDSPAPPKTTSKVRPPNRQPQGSTPRRVRPSSGSAGSAGAENRGKSERMTKRKLKEAAQAKEAEDGGYAVQARGKVRRQGIFVPIGNDRSCLRDAMRAAMLATKPSLALKEDAWCATEHWCCTEH
jgi:hypothetical protein